MSTAVITGASRGLGRVLAAGLARGGWSVVVDGRDAETLQRAAAEIGCDGGGGRVVAVAGDVTNSDHRVALVEAAKGLGGLDLLVHNASLLGPSPQPFLADYPLDILRRVFEVNVVAPLALTQAAIPLLSASPVGRVLYVTSDAAVEAYEGWGGYGSSKAALDHQARVLAAEQPELRVWAVDPGDLRTQMHQEAFPGEDISDRPLPETVVPDLMALIASLRPSGRYRITDLRHAGGGSQ